MRRILITAGPTHEPIDGVRYIVNRSSGRMGLAIASAARDAGWDVTLFLGPVAVETATGLRTYRFRTADELGDLLSEHFSKCDVLIMAAAVADYRPVQPGTGKTPRTDKCLTLQLEPTPDLLARCARHKRNDQFIVGFALEEPQQLERRAKEKLARKRIDAIVANPLHTMGAATIEARMILSDGRTASPPRGVGDQRIGKDAFAVWLIHWLGDHLPS